jgi:hypothetical protein
MSDDTYYTVLGIPETATQGEIERRFQEFIAAYRVLSDSTQRSSYDQQLAQGGQQNVPSSPASPKAAATSPAHSSPAPPIELDWYQGAYCLFPPRDTSPPNPRPQHGEGDFPWGAWVAILLLFAYWYPVFVVVGCAMGASCPAWAR